MMHVNHLLARKTLQSLLAAGMLFILAACAGSNQEAGAPTPRSNTATPIPTQRHTSTPIPTQAPSPDLTGETLTIHVIASTDEPFTPLTAVVLNGLRDYADFRNAHGGINGAEIAFEFAEVDSSGAGAMNAYELFSARQDTLLILVLAPINQELYEAINAGEVPVITFGAGASKLELTSRDDHLFWLVPRPDQQLAAWLDYAVNHWEDIRPEGSFDVMRLNYISWDSTLGGFERLVDMRDYLQAENILLVNQGRLTPLANASAANPILDGVFSRATMIYLDLFSYGPALVLNDLYYLDLGGFFTLGGGSWSLGIDLETYMPFPNEVETLYTPLPIAAWAESDNPGIQAAEEIFEFSGGEEDEKQLGYLYALSAADLAAAALETALIEQKNAPRVEPADVYQALSEIEQYQILGGLMTVDFSTGTRTPMTMRIWKYSAREGLLPISEMLPLVELE